jgi:hypothetical protein
MIDRKYSDGTIWPVSIDCDDDPDGNDGGYDSHANYVIPEAMWDCWLGMQEIMTLTPPGHAVPQLPELKAGALNWGEMTELGAFPTRDEFESMLDEQLAAKVAA